jgi:glycerol-3-phosphate O-acyltransferase
MAGTAVAAAAPGRRTVYLLDAATAVEERLLLDWVEARPAAGGPGHECITIPSSRRPRRRRPLDPRLEASLAAADDPIFAPLRVAWLPGDEPSGQGLRSFLRLLILGDPRDPGSARQRWLLRRAPERARVVDAEPAPASDLRRRWRSAVGAETTGLAEFVARQAYLALERAERRIRGSRYKVPRFVREEILARASFRGGIARLARELGKDETRALRDAGRCLREIAATHSPYVIDLTAHLIHMLYTRGYREELRYDREQLERVYALTQRHPVVFLPSHKSNLDHLVLQYALHENGHPPNHTAGGINMNFFPVGPIVRRSGVFFIRRSFKDDPIYKFVLQSYIDYLVEKRFSLEWYIEGGRSRSGKLLPPRFGMLAYVVDAYRRGRAEDVHLIPVAIAYDQIQDVGSYAAEQRGAAKEAESFGWFVGMVRGFKRRSGQVSITFGEPLSLAETLGAPDPDAAPNPDERSLAVQKLAFEVSVRINRATPITATSLVTLALLGCGDQALSIPEAMRSLENILAYVSARGLPTTGPLDLDTADGVRRALDLLVENGVVTCYDEGPEAVYAIGADQHLTAAYYRNTIIHFFVTSAIAELSLLAVGDERRPDGEEAFTAAALGLRDLLKFEFFFPEKDAFLAELRDEVALQEPLWRDAFAHGPVAVQRLVRSFRPYSAHRVLQPFLEAYRVVGDTLESVDPAAPIDRGAFLRACMALGQQYQLQRRIRSPESISRVLFTTALQLAANRSLLEPGAADLGARRAAFAEEIRVAAHNAELISLLAAGRRAGLSS